MRGSTAKTNRLERCGANVRLSRRALMALPLAAALPRTTRATQDVHAATVRGIAGPVETLGAGMWPPSDLGQAGIQVFVPQTGHTLRGVILDYWRANGGASVYGYPISEPFASPGGLYSQAFERGIFQYRPDLLWTAEPIVRLMPVVTSLLAGNNRESGEGRRANGGGDPRQAMWQPLAADSDRVRKTLEKGGVYFEETGHTLSGAFLAWWRAHEGWHYLGPPISQRGQEGGRTVQYFFGAALADTDDTVALFPIGRGGAGVLRLDTTPVPQLDLPAFDERLFMTAPNPYDPAWDPDSPGRKRIEVSIADQALWAFQGESLVLWTLVSTGLPPNDTELGQFHIRLKYLEQDMAGFTSSTGEVVGFGEDAPEGTTGYAVEDVPHVMYINLDAEALHGTYWHNNFGQKMSHGCINLPLDVAAFLFGWAPLGTQVWVHD